MQRRNIVIQDNLYNKIKAKKEEEVLKSNEKFPELLQNSISPWDDYTFDDFAGVAPAVNGHQFQKLKIPRPKLKIALNLIR